MASWLGLAGPGFSGLFTTHNFQVPSIHTGSSAGQEYQAEIKRANIGIWRHADSGAEHK